jgi:hypothetical protein
VIAMHAHVLRQRGDILMKQRVYAFKFDHIARKAQISAAFLTAPQTLWQREEMRKWAVQ